MLNNPPALYALQKMNAAMAEALRQCRDQFQFYADEHERAGKMEKAETNKRFAKIAADGLNYKLPKSAQAMLSERNRGGDDDA